MSTMLFYFRGLSLHEVLDLLEGDEEICNLADEISIFPPNNACADITDEDSGAEESVNINNLPALQLQAPAEIRLQVRKNAEGISSDDSDDDLPLSVLQAKLARNKKKNKQTPAKNQKTFTWVKEDLPSAESNFQSRECFEVCETAMEIFSKFFDDEVIELILTETNKYALKQNRPGDIEKFEIMAFVGVIILSGYVQVPRRKMYWETGQDAHNILVAEAITRNRFDFIFSNWHVCDNDKLDTGDKFAKVRPLFNLLNKKFMENAPIEEMHSVDEAMVPYYGRHGCKQYIHAKPIRYGYKLWVGTTRLGYINWFEPYQGASTNISKDYADLGVGAGVVLEYAQAVRTKWPEEKFHLFFDNFFSSIHLVEKLTEWNLNATGTIRENRLKGAPLISTKDMKKKSRGSMDYAKITNQNIISVKWNDNNVVCLISNSAGVSPIHSVQRYSQKEKKIVQVEQPHLIYLYNSNMGGVDRSDQNISLYRSSIRGEKWYTSLLVHCIDMALQNSWHLHRQQGGQLDQLSFRRVIATMLLQQNRKSSTYQKGRPSTSQVPDLRYDRLDHLVIVQDRQTRCAFCHQKTTTRCLKCDVGLHTKCFVDFHSKV